MIRQRAYLVEVLLSLGGRRNPLLRGLIHILLELPPLIHPELMPLPLDLITPRVWEVLVRLPEPLFVLLPPLLFIVYLLRGIRLNEVDLEELLRELVLLPVISELLLDEAREALLFLDFALSVKMLQTALSSYLLHV